MTAPRPRRGGAIADHWLLDPSVVFLNHGSFGACPAPVLAAQQRIRERMEREPVRFFLRELPALIESAKSELGAFLGADPEDLVFVANATSGVNAVLGSLRLDAGDELLVTSHEYNACRNALDAVAARSGARVVVAEIPFPINSEDQVIAALIEQVTPRTRLALVDHVTSQTGLVFPVARIVAELAERGVQTLIDGAHAPGMVPLALDRLGADYYTGNCHKWLCAPKAAAFLHVRRDHHETLRPLVVSHGRNAPPSARSQMHVEFEWTGTYDPSPQLCVADAIRFIGSLLPGGWPAVMAGNRDRALAARRVLCDALGVAPPSPDSMIGALVTVPLPDDPRSEAHLRRGALEIDPLQDRLFHEHGIEVPVFAWPAPPRRMVRMSAAIYGAADDAELLASALSALLAREREAGLSPSRG
jgi:isopenicillin-N epimerase